MSSLSPSQLAALPAGVYVVGKAVGDFTYKSVTTGKGRTLNFVEGQVLAGTTFCNVSEMIEAGQQPYLPVHEDEVRAFVLPDFKANNVFKASVRLSRPTKIETPKVGGTK